MNQFSEEEFNHDKLASSLENKLFEDPEIYKGYVEKYSNNQQVLARISDHNYLIEIQDLKILSEIYKVGFCLYIVMLSIQLKMMMNGILIFVKLVKGLKILGILTKIYLESTVVI